MSSNGNYNAAGWPGAVTGTTNDSATGSHGISAVNVSIQDSGTSKCWNGTNFTTASCPNYVAVTSGGSAAGGANANWSYTLANSALTNGDTYTVQVQSTDATANGNTSGNLAAGTFTYDTAAPSSATLSSNGNYNTAGWPGAVTGTVSDSGTGGHGISAVNVSIQDSSTSKCWNGTNFTTASCPNYVAVTSGGSAAGNANANWSYTLANSALTNGDTYTVQIQATDATINGTTSGNLAAGTFTYDTSAPSSATLSSSGNYNAAGWPGAVTGTVSDAGTGSHGISAVNVSIQDSGTSKCWNGTNFATASCPNYVAVTSGGSAAGGANANWSYTLANSALTDGDTYTVQIQATDATTNGTTSGNLAAGTFTYDTSAPTAATLSSNGNYNAAGWPGAVTGTTNDSGTGSHGISAVNVSIQDSTTGKCWNGTNFTTATCPNYVAVTSGGSAAGGANANWSYTLANSALTNGDTYTVKVQSTDATTNGNISGNLSAGTFTYDTAAPTAANLSSNGNYNAAGWPGAVTGTTNDSATGSHGISAVNVSIQDSTTGKCWNGTNFTTATCPNYVAVTSGGSSAGGADASWSYTLANSALTNGDTYTVQVQSTDATANGNTSGNLSAGTFTYDTSAPSSATLTSNGVYNAGGWPGAVSGTVSDSGTGGHGINAVNVSVQDSGTGKCWNGTDFTTASCPNYVAVTTGGNAAGNANANWSYNLVTANLTDGDTYTVQVQATDATTNGNASGNLAAGTFVYDTSAPTIATLTSNGTYNAGGWPGAVSGTATDLGTGSHGISAVNVSIQDSTTGKCWNGTDFTTATCPNYVAVTSGGTASGGANANWSYNLVTANLTDGDTYTVNVQATDATTDGNTSGDLSVGAFKYDASAPASATLTSNGNYNSGGWPGAVSGTVSDSGTGSDGISAVNVSIQDSTTGKCWNGTNFTTATCPNYVAVSSGGTASGGANANWSYTLANSALADGDTYTVKIQAADATTNGNTSGNLSAGTFTYDTSAPAAATLTPNGNYNSGGWPGAVSGTVSDSGTGGQGISAVNVSIQDSTTGKCWNGTNFTTATCPNYVAVSSGGTASGGANANWSYTLANSALTDGDTYTVKIQATDATTNGNTSGNLSAGTFTYDTSAPAAATLTSNGTYNAAGWPGAVSGTTNDSGTGGHGISVVNVSIQDSTTGKCWNGTNFTTATCPNYVAVSSGGTASGNANANWSYTLANSALTDGDTYTVKIQATDATNNGNTSGNLSAGTFTYDTSAPAAATLTTNGTYNAAGWPGAVSGTATDLGTGSHGISAVNVSIQDSTTGKCWNGSDFATATCPNYVAVTSGGTASGSANANWSYTIANSALTDGDTYTVQVQATDATTNGNTSGNLSAGTFVYDTSAPTTATLTTNGDYNAAGWPGAVSGTVSDSGTGSHGISAVNVSIQDSVTGKCWNGSDFTTATCPNFVAVSSGGTASGGANANWSYTLANGALTDGRTYTVKIQATDATISGNTSGTLSAGTFTYDTSAPSSATLTTNGTYNAAGWPGAVTGTTSDSGTGSHGISAVNVSIQDSTTGKCWNGTDFTTATCPNYIAVSSGGTASGSANANWSYTLANSALTDGDTYTVKIQASDATTSGNTSGNLAAGTFTYDTSAPSSATLTSNGTYNAAGWPGAVSGTTGDSGTGGHGISAVNVSIQDSTTGKCWNGTDFTTATCPNYIAVSSGGTASGSANANWSYTLANSALTDGDTYTVKIQASDATTSGNTSGNLAAGTFTYDTSAPSSATLTSNGDYNAAGWPGAVSGTVSDSGTGGHGVSAVNVSIEDSGTSKCWNGSDFTTATCPNYVAVTSGGTASRQRERELELHAQQQRPQRRRHLHRQDPGDRRDDHRHHERRPLRRHLHVRHLESDRLDRVPGSRRALQRERLDGDDLGHGDRRGHGQPRHRVDGALDPEGRRRQLVLGRHQRVRPLRRELSELGHREQRDGLRCRHGELDLDTRHGGARRRLDVPGHAPHEGRDDDRQPELERRDELVRLRHDRAGALDRRDERGRHDADADVRRAPRHRLDTRRGRLRPRVPAAERRLVDVAVDQRRLGLRLRGDADARDAAERQRGGADLVHGRDESCPRRRAEQRREPHAAGGREQHDRHGGADAHVDGDERRRDAPDVELRRAARFRLDAGGGRLRPRVPAVRRRVVDVAVDKRRLGLRLRRDADARGAAEQRPSRQAVVHRRHEPGARRELQPQQRGELLAAAGHEQHARHHRADSHERDRVERERLLHRRNDDPCADRVQRARARHRRSQPRAQHLARRVRLVRERQRFEHADVRLRRSGRRQQCAPRLRRQQLADAQRGDDPRRGDERRGSHARDSGRRRVALREQGDRDRHHRADGHERDRVERERLLQRRNDDPRPGRVQRVGHRHGSPAARAEHIAGGVGDLHERHRHQHADLRLRRPGRRQRRTPRLRRDELADTQRRHDQGHGDQRCDADARDARQRRIAVEQQDARHRHAGADRHQRHRIERQRGIHRRHDDPRPDRLQRAGHRHRRARSSRSTPHPPAPPPTRAAAGRAR